MKPPCFGTQAIQSEAPVPSSSVTDSVPSSLEKAVEQRRQNILALQGTEIVLQVRDNKHATSEEVLKFCMNELSAGTTYNELRLKLGCGASATDRRWRLVRSALAEIVLPDSEEEALKYAHSLSNFMISQIEKFQKKMSKRAEAQQGEENEAQFLKLELDAMKLVMEKYDSQTEHYLKMKAIQKREKRTQGRTVVFNNKFYVARPGGENQLEEAAKLVVEAQRVEDEKS